MSRQLVRVKGHYKVSIIARWTGDRNIIQFPPCVVIVKSFVVVVL